MERRNTMEKYRFGDIQKATLNGRKVKLFKAFEYDKDAKSWVFCGQFEAPQKTANKNLINYITSK
jgi:hypothetical protein